MITVKSRVKGARLLWGVALAIVAASCGNNNSSGSSLTGGLGGGPTNPTPPSGSSSGSACRTYATGANVRTTTSASSIVFDGVETGNFDTSTRKATVETKFANGAPCSTGVTSYNSVADFVDEVRVIPGVFLATGTTNMNSGACGTAGGSLTYTYDSQRRLISTTTSAGAGTTYTAWDSSGRPTAGTTSTGGTITNVYDDAARTQTQTQLPQNAVSTLSFDPNGIQSGIVVVEAGVTSTTTFTTTATATVCQ
jgi:YD repeat-containing protein